MTAANRRLAGAPPCTRAECRDRHNALFFKIR